MAGEVHSAAPSRNFVPIAPAALRRTVWGLAWPVIATLFSEALVGLVDTLMVGRLGADAVAGVGVGSQILGAVGVVSTAVVTGTVALVARHVGAGETRMVGRVVGQSIVLAFALALLAVIPVVAWTPEAVGLFGVGRAVIEPGVAFTRLVMLSIPGGAVLFVIGGALRAAGDVRTPLAIGLGVNVINVILNYMLIFGRFGAPAFGVRGSALASTIAFTWGAAVGLWLLASKRSRLQLDRDDLRFDPITMRRVARIGIPAGVEQLAMQIGFLVYVVFASHHGTSAVAAYFIGVRILALSFLPGIGFSTAASALVGQSLGAADPAAATRAGWAATGLGVALMSTLGCLLVAFAGPIAGVFVDDPAVIVDTRWFIYMLGICQPLMAIDYTLGGALRGAGDTRFPLWTLFVGLYGCRLAFAWVVTYGLGLGVPWLWAALIGDYAARAGLKTVRFRGSAWQRVRV